MRLRVPTRTVKSHLNESGLSVPLRYAAGAKSGQRSRILATTSWAEISTLWPVSSYVRALTSTLRAPA